MEETVGPVSKCRRKLLRGWWRPIGLIVSYDFYSVSPEYLGYILVYPKIYSIRQLSTGRYVCQ
jgi:hypothetical protein